MSFPSDTSPGLHLPQPSADGSVNAGQYGTQAESVPSPIAPSAVPGANLQFQAPVSNQTMSGQVQAAAQGNDQADELDKEWINKAKLIVEQTKHDPHNQSKEIGRAKADYLRIRFNKHIKLGQDQTL